MKKNNKGYSMVEMIIVIAIIAVVSGLGFLTLNIVYTAKATSAANTLRTQVSTLKTKTKAQDANMAMCLHYNSTKHKYAILFGTYDGSTWSANTNIDTIYLPDYCAIYYTPTGGTENLVKGPVYIKFNKSDGTMLSGSGVFRIAKTAGAGQLERYMNGTSTGLVGTTVETIVMNKNTGGVYKKSAE